MPAAFQLFTSLEGVQLQLDGWPWNGEGVLGAKGMFSMAEVLSSCSLREGVHVQLDEWPWKGEGAPAASPAVHHEDGGVQLQLEGWPWNREGVLGALRCRLLSSCSLRWKESSATAGWMALER